MDTSDVRDLDIRTLDLYIRYRPHEGIIYRDSALNRDYITSLGLGPGIFAPEI